MGSLGGLTPWGGRNSKATHSASRWSLFGDWRLPNERVMCRDASSPEGPQNKSAALPCQVMLHMTRKRGGLSESFCGRYPPKTLQTFIDVTVAAGALSAGYRRPQRLRYSPPAESYLPVSNVKEQGSITLLSQFSSSQGRKQPCGMGVNSG